MKTQSQTVRLILPDNWQPQRIDCPIDQSIHEFLLTSLTFPFRQHSLINIKDPSSFAPVDASDGSIVNSRLKFTQMSRVTTKIHLKYRHDDLCRQYVEHFCSINSHLVRNLKRVGKYLYQFQLNITGLIRTGAIPPTERVLLRSLHNIELALSSQYPRKSPTLRVLSEIFHPVLEQNSLYVLPADGLWRLGECLSLLVKEIAMAKDYQPSAAEKNERSRPFISTFRKRLSKSEESELSWFARHPYTYLEPHVSMEVVPVKEGHEDQFVNLLLNTKMVYSSDYEEDYPAPRTHFWWTNREYRWTLREGSRSPDRPLLVISRYLLKHILDASEQQTIWLLGEVIKDSVGRSREIHFISGYVYGNSDNHHISTQRIAECANKTIRIVKDNNKAISPSSVIIYDQIFSGNELVSDEQPFNENKKMIEELASLMAPVFPVHGWLASGVPDDIEHYSGPCAMCGVWQTSESWLRHNGCANIECGACFHNRI